MNKCKQNIGHMYRPNYIAEKNEKKKLNQYITNLDCNANSHTNTINLSSLDCKGTEMTKWRGCMKKKRSLKELLRQYEVNQILKQYKDEMSKDKKVYSSNYIAFVANLLTLNNQKEYLKQRIHQMQLEKSSNETSLFQSKINKNNSLTSSQKIFPIKKSKYHNKGTTAVNKTHFQFRTIDTYSESKENGNIKGKNDEDREENRFIDPDQEEYGNNEEIRRKCVMRLTKDNRFYNPKPKLKLDKGNSYYSNINVNTKSSNKTYCNTPDNYFPILLSSNNNNSDFISSYKRKDTSKNYFFKFLKVKQQKEKKTQ